MDYEIEDELKDLKTENIVDFVLYKLHKEIDSMEDVFACQFKDNKEVYCLDL